MVATHVVSQEVVTDLHVRSRPVSVNGFAAEPSRSGAASQLATITPKIKTGKVKRSELRKALIGPANGRAETFASPRSPLALIELVDTCISRVQAGAAALVVSGHATDHLVPGILVGQRLGQRIVEHPVGIGRREQPQ